MSAVPGTGPMPARADGQGTGSGTSTANPGPHGTFAIHAVVAPLVTGIWLTSALMVRHPSYPWFAHPFLVAQLLAGRVVVAGIVMAALSGAITAWYRARRGRVPAWVHVVAGVVAGSVQELPGIHVTHLLPFWHPGDVLDLVVAGAVSGLACHASCSGSGGPAARARGRVLRLAASLSDRWHGRSPGSEGEARTTGPGGIFSAYLFVGPLLGLADLVAIDLGHATPTALMFVPPSGMHDSGMREFAVHPWLLLMFPVGAYVVGVVPAVVAGAVAAVAAVRGADRWTRVALSVPGALAGDAVFGTVSRSGGLPTGMAHLSLWASVVLSAYLVRVGGDPDVAGPSGVATLPVFEAMP